MRLRPFSSQERAVASAAMRAAASLPPPYHTVSPFLAVSEGSTTAYPVTWPRVFTLYRRRTSTPAWSRRAKYSPVLAAEAAAVATWRSPRP
jgi:hypothetical protein